MHSKLARLSIAALASLLIFSGTPSFSYATTIKPFPVAPHNETSIEWWYLFAHLTTQSGHHEAVVISFFRFGNLGGQQSPGSSAPLPSDKQDHYLICGITDEDSKAHQNFSLADKNTQAMMQQMATLAMLAGSKSPHEQEIVQLAAQGEFPPPTKLIPGVCDVKDVTQFSAVFGRVASLKATPGKTNTYDLTFSQPGKAKFKLEFSGEKTPMYVGGDGNTGVVTPTDMKYVSLTRCAVTGAIDVHRAMEQASGDGWFDHQWGSSWTPTAVGWDWFGIQLQDGRDILLFRQRHLSDGSIFAPLATIEDKNGNLTVTRNLTFTPDPNAIWTSPKTGVSYPLVWQINLPDQKLTVYVKTPVIDQELPALGNAGGAIWEGTVNVKAEDYSLMTIADGMASGPIRVTAGTGYMELVGYGDPTVAATLPNH